jgi:16S rRNA (guanine966-N2)-methyltransferase
MGTVRVIAGEAKGRRLSAPAGLDVRPTSDRVREALFSMLEAHLGDLDGQRVADLACGSGALGIEALSRGAGSCTFVDSSARSLRAARANVETVGLAGPGVSFVKDDLVRWAGLQQADALDLVLVDPPYAWDGWPTLLEGLAGKTAAVAAEADRDIAPPPGWASLRSRRHGGTVVTVFVPHRDPRP